MSRSRRVAVIGAGVSGLTAAYRLRREFGDDITIDVYDEADRPGGLLRMADVGGTAADVGAEAFIVRRPEALQLVTELGLADRIVSPGPLRPAIWSGAALHPLPTPALMGIPAAPASVAGLVDAADLERMAGEPDAPFAWTPGDDPSVGELVGERFGRSVVARSVDPMLGGVYSALADQLGLREAVPALARALDDGAPSLTAAVDAVLAAGASGTGPVFGALRGGYRELVEALLAAGRAEVRYGTEVVGVRPGAAGVTVTLDDAAEGRAVDYDAAVIAVPIWSAARLLADAAPDVASVFGDVRAAGSAVVAVAVAEETPLPEHSGVLVATDAGLRIKAVTLSSQKWPHLRSGPVRTLRTSFGRLGDPVVSTDDELITASVSDLGTLFTAAGLPAPEIVDAVVQRWPGGLPHYAPGHLARVREAFAAVPGRIGVAGSGYAGVGVPACIGTAEAAVAGITAYLHT
ncbi:protoporphyrinogen oxidase [Gordonia neofelifaecis]|uniref:Coproporphyrinogen III oxidase n=1 Tax=Gordonia neofelifaecis NRRL B-59395 TaxID=644548 RepID=F1YMM0_9ACTN|nr:protoporphyrinogen oxidase [Gordonia neofelifaecis]EGD53955.1 protoporphyrinogen oxidase [Gordonia neofelifaecis NRRL B-59395]